MHACSRWVSKVIEEALHGCEVDYREGNAGRWRASTVASAMMGAVCSDWVGGEKRGGNGRVW